MLGTQSCTSFTEREVSQERTNCIPAEAPALPSSGHPSSGHSLQPRSHLPSPGNGVLFTQASTLLNLSQLREGITQSIFKSYKLALRRRLSPATISVLEPLT